MSCGCATGTRRRSFKQRISGYQLQHNLTAGFEAFPAANPSTYVSGLGSVQPSATQDWSADLW